VTSKIERERVALGASHRSPFLSPLQSTLFAEAGGVAHGLTRRVAGAGTAEANISYTAPRDQHEAWRMRQQWCATMGMDPLTLVVPHQIHGGGVAIVRKRDAGSGAAPGSRLVARADAVVTSEPGITLMTTHADCLPMLLYAPSARVIAAVHAGWRSTVAGIVPNTLRTMTAVHRVHPDEILAFIGPSICRECYQVGEDVARAWLRVDPGDSAAALRNGVHPLTFDLVAANYRLLLEEGVPAQNVEVSGLCTRCDGDQWFSHRAQGPYTGRFGALIALVDRD
jgi:YfiH family protein